MILHKFYPNNHHLYYRYKTSPHTCKKNRKKTKSSKVWNQSNTFFLLLHGHPCTRTSSVFFPPFCAWSESTLGKQGALLGSYSDWQEDVTRKKWLKREERKGHLYAFLAFLHPIITDIFKVHFQQLPRKASFPCSDTLHSLTLKATVLGKVRGKCWQYFPDCNFKGSTLNKSCACYHNDS